MNNNSKHHVQLNNDDIIITIPEGMPPFYSLSDGDCRLLQERLDEGTTQGEEVLFYETEDGGEQEHNLKVRWERVDWKEIAARLYKSLNDEPTSRGAAMQMFEEANTVVMAYLTRK